MIQQRELSANGVVSQPSFLSYNMTKSNKEVRPLVKITVKIQTRAILKTITQH